MYKNHQLLRIAGDHTNNHFITDKIGARGGGGGVCFNMFG